jgi:hypothetical protein
MIAPFWLNFDSLGRIRVVFVDVSVVIVDGGVSAPFPSQRHVFFVHGLGVTFVNFFVVFLKLKDSQETTNFGFTGFRER